MIDKLIVDSADNPLIMEQQYRPFFKNKNFRQIVRHTKLPILAKLKIASCTKIRTRQIMTLSDVYR